jgi:hypothetical protein
MVVGLRPHHQVGSNSRAWRRVTKRLLPVPTAPRIRCPRLDESRPFLSRGCSWLRLPPRRGARLFGDCTTPSEIERSTNGGASWKRIVATGSAPIVRLGTEPSGLFTIGGTGRSCSVRYVAYASDGAVTASTTSPPNVWFPTPKDRDEINGPSGAQANPCKRHVIGFAPLKPSQALTVCDDGAARSTHNSIDSCRHKKSPTRRFVTGATSSACFSAAVASADLQALLTSAMCLTTALVGLSLSRRSQRFVCWWSPPASWG